MALEPRKRNRETDTANIEDKTTVKVSGGGGFAGAQAQGEAGFEHSKAHVQKYFEKLEGWISVSQKTRRKDTARWQMSENKIQKFGISPDLKAAVLVKRDKPGKWMATVEMTVKSRWSTDVGRSILKTLQIVPDKSRIPFTSSGTVGTHHLVDTNQLGKLMAKGELAKLLEKF